MRNILTVHLSDSAQNSVLNADSATELILMVKPLSIQKTGLKLAGNASDGTSVESDELELDNGMIRYTVPFDWYKTQGTWQLKVISDEGDSTYIQFNTSVTLLDTDDAKVRYSEGVFIITRYNGSETLLWQNANPSSAFSAQNVTLAEAASEFDAIRIIWHSNTSATVDIAIDYDMNDVISLYTSGSAKARFAYTYMASSYHYDRVGYFTNTDYNVIHFNAAQRLANTSTSNQTTMCIPVAIYGLRSQFKWNKSSFDVPDYEGEYVIIPQAFNEVVLPTANTRLLQNVTVLEVPYSEVSNLSDGKTVYIASEVE